MKSPSQFPERGFPTTCTGEVLMALYMRQQYGNKYPLNYPIPSSGRSPLVSGGPLLWPPGRKASKPVRALCKPTTRDHTALKGVIDRPEMGITQASSTFSACPRSEWGKGIPPKGRVGMDLPSRHRCIRNRLAGLLLTGGI